MNKLLDAGFIEGRVLPVVLAFGLGVIAATSRDTQLDAASRLALRNAVAYANECNALVGLPELPLPPVLAASEVRP